MALINVMRTWADDALLATQRAGEAQRALGSLVRDARAVHETELAVADGGTWDEPMEALRDLAEDGNRGLWDAWTKTDAARTVLTRAAAKHPGGDGRTELIGARDAADRSVQLLDAWISEGGRSTPLARVESAVSAQLQELRRLAGAALDA